jgi:mono/diheme cytochrome c family protein
MADQVSLQITAYLTRNNSERDEQDDALWADLQREVRELVAAKCPGCHGPRFELIRAEVY